MDYVQIFSDELHSVLRTKPSISKAKMVQITRAAIKGIKFYKHIVQTVEKFIARCRPEYMISGLYVIDSIVRQSRHQFGVDRDVYTSRFSRNICITFETLLNNCLPEDKSKILRVLNLWQKNGVFDCQVLQPLMEMASSTSSLSFPRSPDSRPEIFGHSSSMYPNQGCPDNNLTYNRNLLDFDYGEDDDDGDETPTEAEPPLSSTLGKIRNISHQTSSPQLEKPFSKHEQVSLTSRVQRMSSKDLSDSTKDLAINNRIEGRSRSRSPLTSIPQPKSLDTNQPNRFAPSSNSIEQTIQNSSSRLAERAAEREKRCLPKIRDKYLTVCSSTLWLGHLPKFVSEVDISDAFGEYGTISSIDLVPPRGCAYVCMDRRQDAKRALDESRDLKLKNSHIKMAWAPGKGFKEYKKLKDFWESDVGASFIPYSKIDHTIDFDVLEEGGVIDEDSMSMEMRGRRELRSNEKKMTKDIQPQANSSTTMTSLNQTAPTSIQSFGVTLPNLGVPTPSRLNQGLIPFPPPGVATTLTGTHVNLPPPSSFFLGQTVNPQPGSYRDTLEHEKIDEISSPQSIDQQLSLTERQINMVEQQLSMIQQAQGINRAPPMQPMPTIQHPQVFQNQPLMFDMTLGQHIIHSAQTMMDPSFNIFNNQLGQTSMILPTSLANNAIIGLSENFDEHQRNF